MIIHLFCIAYANGSVYAVRTADVMGHLTCHISKIHLAILCLSEINTTDAVNHDVLFRRIRLDIAKRHSKSLLIVAIHASRRLSISPRNPSYSLNPSIFLIWLYTPVRDYARYL